MAQQMGCSHNTVRAAVAAAGVRPRRSGGCRSLARWKGAPRWNRQVQTNGYVAWYAGYYEGTDRRTVTILEHRLVMEQALGRPLSRHEQVHHHNGIRHDNRLENLEVVSLGTQHWPDSCPHCGGRL